MWEGPAHDGQCCFWWVIPGYSRNQAKEAKEGSEETVSPPWLLLFSCLEFSRGFPWWWTVTRKRNKPFLPMLILVPCFITAAAGEVGHKSNRAENKCDHIDTPYLQGYFINVNIWSYFTHICIYLMDIASSIFYKSSIGRCLSTNSV